MLQNMKGFMKALRISSFGLLVVLIGLLYDLWFAGLPYQDPTFEQKVGWDFHSNIANLVIGAGIILFISGFLYALISWLAHPPPDGLVRAHANLKKVLKHKPVEMPE